jgi:hypothetical protein
MQIAKKQKIIFLIEDETNFFVEQQIFLLLKKFDIGIATSSDKIAKKFKKFFIIHKLKKNYIEKIIEKISIIFSSPNFSRKENYYNRLEYYQTKSYTKKIYLIIKRSIFKRKNFYLTAYNIFSCLYKIFYDKNKYSFLKNYNYIFYDFRFFSKYNNLKSIIFASKKNQDLIKICWIYSWDNIITGNVIRSSDYYLVWSNYIKKKLSEIQKINKKNIVTVKPIQFNYLKKIKKKQLFLIYPCSFSGNIEEEDSLLNHDILMIQNLSKILNELNSNCKILVRPYPGSSYGNILNGITKQKNIIFDYNFYNKKILNLKDFEKNLEKKNLQINSSILTISFGTTFSFESAYLGVPSLFLGYSYFIPKKNSLYNFVNYSNNVDEYILLRKIAKKNYVYNHKNLKKIINDILLKKKKYNYYKRNSLHISNKILNYEFQSVNHFLKNEKNIK